MTGHTPHHCCPTAERSHLHRRDLFKLAGGASAAGLAFAGFGAHAASPRKTDLTADQALQLLREGNEKFITDSPIRSAQGRERRLEQARGQTPFAVLVACSDSRVPPELLFGRGLGELFIVRNAGNTVDTVAQGSMNTGCFISASRSSWSWDTSAAARWRPRWQWSARTRSSPAVSAK